jgi:hypothetical protein
MGLGRIPEQGPAGCFQLPVIQGAAVPPRGKMVRWIGVVGRCTVLVTVSEGGRFSTSPLVQATESPCLEGCLETVSRRELRGLTSHRSCG